MRKIIITLLFSVIGISAVFSQHEIAPALSSQLFSRINFNPAGTGNSEKINIFNLNRMQWIGFDGHPSYSILNVHYFNEQIKSGLGGSITYDKISNSSATNAKFTYSYNLDISDKSLLALGVAAGIDQISDNFGSAIYDKESDYVPNESKLNPDFDFGLEYSIPKLLLGASINHLGQMSAPTTTTPTQTYYGYARGALPVTNDWLLAPSLLYCKSSQTSVVNLSAVAFYQGLYWGGLGMRFGAAMSIMLGIEWHWLRAGYTYELSMGKTADISSNTHELMLSFIIPTKSDNSGINAKGKGKKGKAAPTRRRR